MIEDLEELYAMQSREGLLRFLVRGRIRMAKLGEVIEEYVQNVHNAPNPDKCRSRYLKELREQAADLYSSWGNEVPGKMIYTREEIMTEFRAQLGSDYEEGLGVFKS